VYVMLVVSKLALSASVRPQVMVKGFWATLPLKTAPIACLLAGRARGSSHNAFVLFVLEGFGEDTSVVTDVA